jgi:hypothetical protein
MASCGIVIQDFTYEIAVQLINDNVVILIPLISSPRFLTIVLVLAYVTS